MDLIHGHSLHWNANNTIKNKAASDSKKQQLSIKDAE